MTLQNIINKVKPADIKDLILNKGKATINGKNQELRDPPYNNSKLLQIISDVSLSVTLLDTPIKNGIREYELKSRGGAIKVKIYCPHCKQ